MSVNDEAENTATQARGDFDARPGRKKKTMNVRFALIIAGLFIGLFLAVVLVMMTASHYMARKNSVDESKIKSDEALQRLHGRDDAMKKLMNNKDKKEEDTLQGLPSVIPEHPVPVVTMLPDTLPESPRPQRRDPPVSVQDSGIFPAVQRFQSAGLSARAAGDRDPVSGDDPDIEQISTFARAPLSAATAGEDEGASSSGYVNRGRLSHLSGTRFTPEKAYLMPSRQFLVTHNTYTRCALYTGIITDQPALIECRLTEPLYSSDGSVVIAAAGDRLTGEQKVEVRAGQTRVFTTWTELETASGVRAQLNSLGAGPMGASGTEAWIDNHYRQRFGGAVMLSFIQDALQSAANATRKSSSGYTINNSEQNAEGMAGKALENSINIPPTAQILPGTVITVIVARDIDFSSVFSVR